MPKFLAKGIEMYLFIHKYHFYSAKSILFMPLPFSDFSCISIIIISILAIFMDVQRKKLK